MPLTLSTDNLTASGLSLSGSVPTPFIPAPGPQTSTYNSTYAGATSRIRLLSAPVPGSIYPQAFLEIPIPTLTDNQSYPGISAGRVQGGDGGIRLISNLNTSNDPAANQNRSNFLMGVYTDTPASNTYPLQVGRRFSPGVSGQSSYLGGLAVLGQTTMDSTPIGTAAQPGGAYTLDLVRNAPAPISAPSGAVMRMSAGAPGVTAYYVTFQQGAERGSIFTPGSTTTYATSSDYRLKDNITPLDSEEELQRINQLRPRKWNWKTNQDPGVGFIAHELQETFEDANKLGMVSGSKDSVTRKGRIVDVTTGEPIHRVPKIDETTGEETIEYFYVDEPTIEDAANLAADGKEWVYHHDEPLYQAIDTSFLASSTVAAIQALTNRVTSLESRVAALESI
jgi:hypothetical protein